QLTNYEHAISSQFPTLDDLPGIETTLKLSLPQQSLLGMNLALACQEAGITLWIDWANINKIGIDPKTQDTIITHNRSLINVLRDLSRRYDLAVVIRGKNELTITSMLAYRSTTQLFVLPLGKLQPDELTQELRSLTPAYGRVVVMATPDEKFALVRSCAPRIPESLIR
ncbi:MAG: hypothetical protein KDB03_11985, partial [Planctomycetales bacterium]|nr:hypothetical protein [Planctomycetales bacterium]